MFRRILLATAAFVASQALFTLSASAASFADVPRDHPFGASISYLADLKIVTGNPDGNFYPARPVNRAEFLTLLYRAKGWTPSAPSSSCFPDILRGSWYEAVVCDASAKGYVGGYPDGKFRPEKEVNRVESLKMIFKVYGYDESQASAKASTYVDVQEGAWYMPYFKAAFAYGVLPVIGQGTTYYYPESALLRGEAAAYIHNAMNARLSNASSSAASSAVSATSRRSAASSAASEDISIHDFDFPFGDEGTFVKKSKQVYRFSLRAATVVNVVASVNANSSPQGVSCTLFKLNSTGLSYEYYFGFESANECRLNVSLGSGDYQLEAWPKMAGASFSVFTKEGVSNGNDGFREAKVLQKDMQKVGILDVGDTGDWYKFTLAKETAMKLSLSSGNVRCIIYPMDDVSLFSFSGPVCNEEYAYPKGTYYVGVIRENAKDEKQTYTIGY